MKYEQLAAIDIGTNSFHLVAVRADADGRYEIIGREKEAVRLGSGAGDLDYITPEAMDRGIQALQRLSKVAESMQAPARAVATSAVREASNQSEFLQRAKAECGLAIDVIPGTEEARLIYLGILESLPLYDERLLMIDIGGGSTEYLIGRRAVPEFAVSLKLGAIRLKDRFFSSEPLTHSQINECRHYIRVALSGVQKEVSALGYQTAVGSSGTIETLSDVIRPRPDEDGALRTDIVFTREELDEAVARILHEPTAKKRVRIEGLDDKRADIIVPGAILLQESFRALGIRQMRVSPTALREGVIRDTLARRSGFGTAHDIRRSSVLHLAESFHRKGMSDIESSKHTAFLASQLFDGLFEMGLLKGL
ncbi:MAG: Ppx/GppA family phosphatase, partial [Spirochaetia bacterium]|nr:Ppx/GppA family phosphatase [Spirochaetia bacterium]